MIRRICSSTPKHRHPQRHLAVTPLVSDITASSYLVTWLPPDPAAGDTRGRLTGYRHVSPGSLTCQQETARGAQSCSELLLLSLLPVLPVLNASDTTRSHVCDLCYAISVTPSLLPCGGWSDAGQKATVQTELLNCSSLLL